MTFNWETIAANLESPIASGIYALVAALLLIVTASQFQKLGTLDVRRVGIPLGILATIRAVEVVVFGAAWVGNPVTLRLMPTIERGAHLITILGLGWLWANRGTERSRPFYFGFASSVVFIISIGLALVWLNFPATSFNYTSLDYLWSGACLMLLLVSWVLLITGRHNSGRAEKWQSFVRWKTQGSIVFFFFLFGQLIHLLLAEPFGNMPLATELASLAALSVLLSLAVRGPSLPVLNAVTSEDTAVSAELELENSTNAFHFELARMAKETADNYSADACAFVRLREDLEEITLEAGYNLLRDVTIVPSMIRKNQAPRIVEALRKGNLLRLTAEGYSPEIAVLGEALGLSVYANLLAAPIPGISSIKGWGVIMLRGNVHWQPEDEINLETQTRKLSHKLSVLARKSNKSVPELNSYIPGS